MTPKKRETLGGALLLSASVLALVFANFNFDGYAAIRDLVVGPAGFDLSLGKWASDGLLAIFFFVVGMELKHEFKLGSLRERSVAAVPIAAAIGGMIVPAGIFFVFNSGSASGVGWGIPMATDIAFALAVLAVAGRSLPSSVRVFLLTLAVVDDLGAILVIAIFYTAAINFVALMLALVGLVVFWYLQRLRVSGWYVYVPLALVIWGALHASGIHATIAGVAIGLLVRLDRAPQVSRVVEPISSWFAVPVFAFFAAGVNFTSLSFGAVLGSSVAMGIIVGLVVGKPLGVFGTAWLVSRFTRASLPANMAWVDVAIVGVLAGVGFTVSLLINELAFKGEEQLANMGTLAVLIASTIAAILATVSLQLRKRA